MWPEDGGARLQLEFIAAPGRRVGDGPLHEGGVADDARGLTYNLHEPGVVRRLVDAAIERGYRVDGPPMTLDGWLVLPGP